MPKQEFDNDDRGYFAKNTERKGDKQPSHKGKITLSKATLKGLNAMFHDGEEPVVYLAGWPGQKGGILSVKVELPQNYRDDAGGSGRQQSNRGNGNNSGGRQQQSRNGNNRRNVSDDLDDEAPF